MARSENLAIMFTDMVGFTETTSSQSRDENETMLRKHDRLMTPIIRRFSGRKIKAIGDAFLVTFRSSTDAIQCGMAMHDAIAEHNQQHPDETQLQIRVALHVGEVRLESNDVFGEAVNIAARIEGMTPPNEVYFSHSVYLSMNKAEIPSEVVGTYKLKGIPERVKIHRVPSHRVARLKVEAREDVEDIQELPFGGMHRSRKQRVFLPMMPEASWKWIAVLVLAMALAIGVGGLAYRGMQPGVRAQAEPLMVANEWQDAIELAEARLREDEGDPESLLVRGHVRFARNRMDVAREDYQAALEKAPDLRTDTRLVSNIVAAADRSGYQALIEHFASPELIDALKSRAEKPGYWGRQKALQGLSVAGKRELADPLRVAILDLREGPECDHRLDAVKRLGRLQDPAALPALEEAVGGDIKNKVTNLCLWNEARKVIDALGG